MSENPSIYLSRVLCAFCAFAIVFFCLLLCTSLARGVYDLAAFGLAGNLDPAFNGNGIRIDGFGNGGDEINAAAIQPDGKIVVAGRSSVGSYFPAAVFRFNPDGSFDTTFNGSGKVPILAGMTVANAITIQSDGKILVAGTVPTGQYSDFAVVRLNPDGTLDNTFDQDGRVSTPITLKNDIAYAIAVQEDGKIVVGGTDEHPNLSGFFEFALVRYNSDGSLDNAFGSTGKVRTLMSASSNCRSIVVQPDGKIVAAGSGSHLASIARYNTDGTLDTTFDSDGTFSLSLYSFYSVALQSDGKIVAAGSPTANSIDFAIVRLDPDGTLDITFDGDGIVNVPGDFATRTAYAVLIGANGKITAAGGSSGGGFVAARLNPNGSLDSGFGNGGVVWTPLNASFVYPTSAVLQSDGKLVTAGSYEPITSFKDLALTRLNIDGSLDDTFSGHGILKVDVGDNAMFTTAVAVQSDGKVITAGHHYVPDDLGSNWNFAVFRYNAVGTLDPTFDGDGKVSLGIFVRNDDYASSIVVQPDGKVIVAGYITSGSFRAYALVRLNQDGSLDTSFGETGKVFTDISPAADYGNSVLLQSNGKIIVGGASGDESSADFSVARYNSDGTLDSTFNGTGTVITSVGSGNDKAYSVLVQPDGKIVLSGYSVVNGNASFSVVRYSPDGTLDSSFGNNGKVLTLAGSVSSVITSSALQSDGKILVGGRAFNQDLDFVLGRYNTDGTLDAGFGSGGIVTTNLNGREQINGLKIDSDGKIIAVGDTAFLPGNSDFATVRYKPDGTVDTSWGNEGKAITRITGRGDEAYSIDFDPAGNVVVAGRGGGLSAVVRYRSDGSTSSTGSLFDYDGDGRADISVRRQSDNMWHLLRATAGYTAMQFGVTGDRMTPADYDGDGKTDVSVFRPSNGTWYMYMSQSQTFQAFGWGQNGDLPVPTDRDNDGKTDLVIYRPSNNTWYTRFANGTFAETVFGVAGDKPVVGDFDGDGIGDIALFRPSYNNWYIIKSSLGFFIQTWGEPGDVPITGDFDGDGATDQAVFRTSSGQWFLSQTTAGFSVSSWGQDGDVPVPADYDGDGKTDVAVFRPSNNKWYIVQSTSGILVQQFGETGDVPTQTAFNY